MTEPSRENPQSNVDKQKARTGEFVGNDSLNRTAAEDREEAIRLQTLEDRREAEVWQATDEELRRETKEYEREQRELRTENLGEVADEFGGSAGRTRATLERGRAVVRGAAKTLGLRVFRPDAEALSGFVPELSQDRARLAVEQARKSEPAEASWQEAIPNEFVEHLYTRQQVDRLARELEDGRVRGTLTKRQWADVTVEQIEAVRENPHIRSKTKALARFVEKSAKRYGLKVERGNEKLNAVVESAWISPRDAKQDLWTITVVRGEKKAAAVPVQKEETLSERRATESSPVRPRVPSIRAAVSAVSARGPSLDRGAELELEV